MAGRLLLVCGLVLGFVDVAWCEGNYQSTRDGKTLVWNSAPKPGDVATWSGDRDRGDYARGFGRLTWYTRDSESSEPELYARYWGRMVDGKLEGPVNVHVKGKTHHAIFINGTRVTHWSAGTASTRANAQWQKLLAKHNQNLEIAAVRRSESGSAEELRSGEPAAPAAGPTNQISEDRDQRSEAEAGSIRDYYKERWPIVDIDDSLRILAYPPRYLRFR